MTNSAAFRLAAVLRAAAKRQSLNGPALAERVERLTGARPDAMTVSRWLSGRHAVRPMIFVSPHLITMARVLDLDPRELAVQALHAELDHQMHGVKPQANPNQTPDCLHPNLTGEGCSACCDWCNGDHHRCGACGQPVGHRTDLCPDCRPDVE